jgi:glycosyltransferase involved in cell wall biosynthesis
MRPLVSFALVSYNQAGFIREAVEGALAQTYSPLEINIQDDCSTDGTFEIIQEMAAKYSGPHNVQCIRNPKNLGLAGNKNRVMEVCRGELVVCADGDDISVPTRTETIYEAWEQSGREATALFSYYTVISGDSTEQGFGGIRGDTKDPRPCWQLEGELFNFLSTRNPMIHGCTAAYSPDLLKYFGPGWGDLEDMVACFRTLAIGKLYYVNQPLVRYRRHGDNATFYMGGEVLSSFENRERRLRRGNEMTVRTFDNILADIEVLRKNGKIQQEKCSQLQEEAKRVQGRPHLEWLMMNGSILARASVLARTILSGDLRGFLRSAPRGLPRWLYRQLFLLRERWRSATRGNSAPMRGGVSMK